MKPLANCCLVSGKKKATACCEDRSVFSSAQGKTMEPEGMFSSINVVWHIWCFIERRQFFFPFPISFISCPVVKWEVISNPLSKFPDDINKKYNSNNNNNNSNNNNNNYYYSFKILSRFWLIKTTCIIHHNQVLFTKFGKHLCHIESMTSKVERIKN